MKTATRLVCMAFLGLGLLGGAAFAADKPIEPGQYTMSEVVVRGEPAGVESVGTVREITALQIKAMGARTLDQALKMLPGVVVRTGAAGVPRVDIRGFRSRHVVLLLNGIPFNSTFDGQFDPSLIPTENIALIKVTYSNSSVLYGQGGLGGVIDIITKAGRKGLGGRVKAEGGTGDSYLGAFNAYGGSDDADFFVSGSWYQRDNWRVSDDFDATKEQDEGARVGSDKKRGNLFANGQYAPSDNWRLGFSAGAVNGEYSIPPSAINNNKDEFANRPRYDTVEDILGYFSQVSLNYSGTGPFTFRTWAYLNRMQDTSKRYDDNDYDSMSDPKVQTFDLDQTTDVMGINAQAGYDLKRWGRFTLGLMAERDDWEQSGRTRDKRISGTQNYAWRGVDQSQDLYVYGVALEYELAIIKNLELVLGAGQNWQDRSEGDTDGANYLAGLSWQVMPGTRLRGSYAHKIRFPSIRQLYDEENGNTDLGPEESDTFEVGIDQDLPWNSRVSLSAFHIDVQDYIERIGDDIFRNYEEYRFRGFELSGQTQPIDNLWLSAGYTFMDTDDRSPDTDKEELQNRPRHKLTLQGKYTLPFGLSLYMGMQYYADTYYYSRNEPLQKAEYDDYLLLDAKISQSLLNDQLELYVGVDNLLDKDYQESYGFPAESRFVYVGAEATF
jgi:vitamin B12 transporter